MHATVVYNPKSGTALPKSELKALFHDAAITIDAFIELNQSTRRRLKKHIDAGAIVAVVGGDGTISAVAGIIAGTQATLLPLPGGTLNHFTKDLGIDQDLAVAIKSAHRGKQHLVDMAMVNGTPFINNSSIGLYPSSLRDRNRFEDRLGKWPAALAASMRAFVRFRLYEVTINGKSLTTPFVFIGNNTYKLSAGQIERKRIDEAVLSVFIVHTATRLDIIKLIMLSLVGRAEQHEKFDILSTQSLTLRTRQRHIHVSHDGELTLMNTPLHYKIMHKRLKILS